MQLEDILRYGIVIVAAHGDTAITWNRSATYAVWRISPNGTWHEEDVFTNYDACYDGTDTPIDVAVTLARKWLLEGDSDD
jgi:hypothetical protein